MRINKTGGNMKTDVQISREAKLNHILKIAEKINLTEENLEIYGKSFPMIIAISILGIGHIGIHLEHKKKINNNLKKAG